MSESILAVLLLLAAGVIGYLVWAQVRTKRLVMQLTSAMRSGESGERVEALASEGPESAQEMARAIRGILEESRLMAAKASSGEAFRKIISELNQGFLLTDDRYEIRFANDAVRRLFELSESPVGRPLIEACRDHRLVELAREAVESGRRVSVEINMQALHRAVGDLPERLYELEAAALAGDSERGCWILIRDVTEEAMTEQVRKDFVANASHELRTPLTLINGYIETLEDGLIEDEAASRHSLAIMRKHSGRLVRIIEDMLTISKLEGATNTLRMEPFDIGECVRDVINHLSSLIEKKKAKVVLDLEGSEKSIMGDRFYWDQVFMNLIENALKENQQPGLRVKVSFKREGGQSIIKVKDNGIGIPRADLPFIFKRFYRGAKHHSQEVKGTGLGLSIVKRAVEAHGGNISVESTPGIETVFTMSVPVEVTAVIEK